MKICISENLAKGTIIRRAPENLTTAEKLLEKNRDDYEDLIARGTSEDEPRGHPAAACASRRQKCVQLLEELSLRTSKIQSVMKKLMAIHQKQQEISAAPGRDGRRPRRRRRGRGPARRDGRLRAPRRRGRRGPGRPHPAHPAVLRRVRGGQAEPLRRQPAAGGLDRQEVPQPRPLVPRPHPGRQHRPHAGRGQVRVPPRLQVLDVRHVVDPAGHYAGHRRPGPDDPHPGPHDRDDVETAEHRQAVPPGDRPRADPGGDGRGGAAAGDRGARA